MSNATEPVRYLHHQNTERVKAESEIINRFTERQQKEQGKKPPLHSGTTWNGLIERTWVHGADIKRGDFALSEKRKLEMTTSYRIMNTDL